MGSSLMGQLTYLYLIQWFLCELESETPDKARHQSVSSNHQVLASTSVISATEYLLKII